ncbi:MAG: TonB-dependent receptor, partial [Flavitalea sp.]
EISGKVTNEQGEPLQGVSVVVKGTKVGTSTNGLGKFSISVPENSSKILVYSFVGMEPQEIAISNNTTLTVVLKAIDGQEQEIVVRGYGTQKKVNLTGSVASIGGDKLTNRPVTNISQALQGQLPGVQVVTGSGQPGRENTRIKIRGLGTMNNANPMIVVDGLVSSMEDLNPNDIENVSVLKDASASAIYGSRAANGVILITTKRGKSGKPKISYNGYIGQQTPTTLPDFLGSYDYGLLLNEGLRNEGLPEKYTQGDLDKFKSGTDPNYPNTDWMDLLYKGSGLQQSHNVSVSGGSDVSRYLLSLGYLDQIGVIKNTSSERYNVRFNLDSKVSDRLNIGITTTLTRQRIIEPTYGGGIGFVISQLERTPPTELNKYPDGTWARYLDGNQIQATEEGGLATSMVSHGYGSIFAELNILKGLKLRSTAGVDYNIIDKNAHVTDVTFGDGVYQGPNSVTDDLNRTMRVMLQSFLTYQTNFGSHGINLLAGAERESNRLDVDNAFRMNFPSNLLTELNGGSVSGMTNSGYSLDNKLGSYFGRVNYDYKGKYLLEGTLRYDGSSKFASDKRWGLFPSFSAGWRISEETFMKNISAISNMKIRGSYGSVGNNATADYQFIPRIALGQDYPFAGNITPGAAQVSASNANLEWEKSTSFNIGVDAGFFNDRLTLTADYYDRYTDNILIGLPVSAIFGLPAPTVNAGALRNKGVELLLGYRGNKGDFGYNASVNVSFNKNRVEKFPNPSIGTGDFAHQTIKKEGYAWDAFFGYQVAGIYQTDQEVADLPKVPGSPVEKGDLIFKDQNKDGVIDGSDRVVLGSEIPGVSFGINLAFTYKNFDLSLFGQGATDYHQKVTLQYIAPFFNGGKALVRNLDRWTPETPNSKFPRTHVTQQFNYASQSDINIVDASYVRLKNFQLGYTLPKNLTSKAKLDNVRLFISCQNLFTLTKLYKGIDPEAASIYDPGYDGKYNNVKVVTFGLNLNL